MFKRLFKPSAPKPSKLHPFNDEQVRAKAYQLWQQRGDESSSEENWTDAIRELTRERRIKKVLKPVRRLWWQTGLGKPLQDAWRWTGFQEKTGWDILQLLVVPAVLAIGAFYLQEQAKYREQQVSDDKAKQDILVKYLEQMAESLNVGLLKAKPESEQFIIAQARTLTALQSLDKKRQHLIIQFLQASKLNSERDKRLLQKAQMSKANLVNSDLSGAILLQANLSNANLGCVYHQIKDPNQCSDWSKVNLQKANLKATIFNGANLNGANLNGADLREAKLNGASLKGAKLKNAKLKNAELNGAKLNGAELNDADLRGAHFKDADLRGADLNRANLKGSNFNGANLKGASTEATDFSDADLKHAKNLTTERMKSTRICRTQLPKEIALDPNRDCKELKRSEN